MSAFAGFALVLAGVGLYSVVAYSVSRRVREFGIRSALGAGVASIVSLALRSTMLAIFSGLVAGLALSLMSDRIVAQWSIGTLRNPWVLAAISLVFGIVAALAASIPARRAASVAPAIALRAE